MFSTDHFWKSATVLVIMTMIALTAGPTGAVKAAPDLPHPAHPQPLQPAARPAAQAEAEWTILLYQDADDEMLEQDILIDFNEAEVIGSSDEVNIVAQVDRFDGGYDGMGDWTSTKRFYVTQDSDLENIGSEELDDLGETNMADSQTLVDFIVWAVDNFPAQKYALIMSDHGAGWPGGWNDPDPGGLGPDAVAVAELFGVDGMWLMELDQALGEARDQTGLDKFDLIGFDACLMSQLEVFSAVAPHGRYSVASQELEPGVGWAYAGFLQQLTDNPAMSGADLAAAIVSTYIDGDARVVDDNARRAMLESSFGGSEASAEELASFLGQDVTLTAVDLAEIPTVNAAVDNLAAALIAIDPNAVAEARAYAQSFESVFGEEMPSPYIDLFNFIQLVVQFSGDADVTAAAEEVAAALNQAIIAEKHGPERPGATGITIHFPTSELHSIADDVGYTTVAARFADESQWDEFLAAFHSGATFSRPQAEPDQPAAVSDAPAASHTSGRLEITPLTLSAEIATPDAPVTISADISGDRLAYIYTFIGRFLPHQDVLLIEDMDYLIADDTQEIGGIAYPDWSKEGVSVEYEWQPTIYAISNGTDSTKALFRPQAYDPESPTFAVEGIYTFGQSEQQRYAKMFFRDGVMSGIYSFGGNLTGAVGAPREITPQIGDTFTVLERGDDLSLDEEAGRESYVAPGQTLTFEGEPFVIETTPAPSGNYVVGFIAEDLDGQTYEQYEGLFVVNEETEPVDGFVSYVDQDFGFATLYPGDWTVEADPAQASVNFSSQDGSHFVSISAAAYEAANADEANTAALQATAEALQQNGDLENLVFLSEEPDTFVLGAFDAQLVDFDFELDGVAYSASAIASTPTPEATYLVLNVAPADDFEQAVTDVFNPMLYSFDLLISGLVKENIGPPPPDFDEILFSDDFSDTASGLYHLDEEEAWGISYYTTDDQYLFGLNPYTGPIYDYYFDAALPDEFLLQATAGYEGAANNDYGLIFQLQPGEAFDDFYLFRISGDGYFIAEKSVGGELTTLIDWTASSLIDQTENAANVLTVEGRGDSYYLYINGLEVGAFSDADLSGGSFGFVVDNYDEESPVTLIFDDLVVGTPVE